MTISAVTEDSKTTQFEAEILDGLILERINHELDADFDTRKFDYFPVYDPLSGACKSYLISLVDQEAILYCHAEAHHIRFARHGEILMELSQK